MPVIGTQIATTLEIRLERAMSEPVLYRDDLVTVTTGTVTVGEIVCPIAEITETRQNSGTGIEEKIFLSLIAFFGLSIAVVGLVLQDRGELLLGLGLSGVTIWIIFQKCRLILITTSGKRELLRHGDVVYVRKLRNVINDAIEALHDVTVPD